MIDWTLAERLYVEGELEGEAEHTRRVYPTRATIARRAGTTQASLDQYVRAHKWFDKREEFQKVNAIIPVVAAAPSTTGALRAARRKPAARTRGEAEGILVAYIDLFAEAVEKRTLKHESVHDLDKAVRLLAYVRGQAESIKATHATVTLDVMMQRHAGQRAAAHARIDDEVAGVLTQGDVVDAVGVPVEEPETAA